MLRHIRSAMIGASLTLTALTTAALAHPHVWVTYAAVIAYDKEAVTAIDHVWTFDEMYTAMAIEGLDKNNDGKYDREELAELAQTNIDGLKDFDYFTYAKSGKDDVKFAPPQDYWLEYNGGILKLHFRMPLAQPLPAGAEALTLSIFDPSFFIAFDPEKTNPVTLAASAPKSCKATFLDPKTGADSDALKAQLLNDSFAIQLGQTMNIGSEFTKTIRVSCAKS